MSPKPKNNQAKAAAPAKEAAAKPQATPAPAAATNAKGPAKKK